MCVLELFHLIVLPHKECWLLLNTLHLLVFGLWNEEEMAPVPHC